MSGLSRTGQGIKIKNQEAKIQAEKYADCLNIEMMNCFCDHLASGLNRLLKNKSDDPMFYVTSRKNITIDLTQSSPQVNVRDHDFAVYLLEGAVV